MHPEPWIYFCGPNDLLARKAILETLSSNGVVTKSLDINACACRKSIPNILVVQPAQDRAAKNGPG
jgi:hypothetical protein